MWNRIKNWYNSLWRLDKIMGAGLCCVIFMLPVLIFSRLGSYYDSWPLCITAIVFLVIQLSFLGYQITQVILGKKRGDL